MQLAAFLLGNQFGPEGVASAYALATVALALPGLLAAHRIAEIPLAPTLRVLTHPLWATTCAAAAGMLAGQIGGAWGVVLAAKTVAFGLTYGLISARRLTDLRRELVWKGS